MITILRRSIRDMKVEQDVLQDLMKKAQSDYYAKSHITKHTFEIKTSQYQKRMSELKQKLPVVESRLEKRLKYRRFL